MIGMSQEELVISDALGLLLATTPIMLVAGFHISEAPGLVLKSTIQHEYLGCSGSLVTISSLVALFADALLL